MLLKLHVSYGLNKARQLKINFLSFAVYDTVAVIKPLSTSLPVANLTCNCVLYISFC